MKKLKKALSLILIMIVTTVGLVFALRVYNKHKYGNDNLSLPDYYKNVTNISLYPKDIEGVDVKYVDEGTLQGFHLVPEKKIYQGVVICYGGSEGSPNFDEAQRLAKEGYETLAVFMFGMKNQPKTLMKIPLEQFEDVLKYVNSTMKQKAPITVLGVSKGAEYALNLATKYDEISNVILIAPSAYTFAGLDFNDYGSSWTWKKEELPFIDIKKASFPVLVKNILIPTLVKTPVQYRSVYDRAVKQDLDNSKKLIPVQDVKANILMIVGEDDQIWGSYEMAKTIKQQNKNAILCVYKNAGHIFRGDGVLNVAIARIRIGGTLEGNQKADLERKKVMNNFLKQQHSK